MKDNQQTKEYKAPQFKLVRQDESIKVFFAASGTPGAPSLTGGINSMSRGTSSEW